MTKVYLAAPFGELKSDKRVNAESALEILTNQGFEVYAPWKYKIPHAWDYENNEWAQMVFMNDVKALDDSDFVVVLSYGRIDTTSGTNWEAGYAFGIGKKILLVEMTDHTMSLMVANGRYATVVGLTGLANYSWNTLPKLRTKTLQT